MEGSSNNGKKQRHKFLSAWQSPHCATDSDTLYCVAMILCSNGVELVDSRPLKTQTDHAELCTTAESKVRQAVQHYPKKLGGCSKVPSAQVHTVPVQTHALPRLVAQVHHELVARPCFEIQGRAISPDNEDLLKRLQFLQLRNGGYKKVPRQRFLSWCQRLRLRRDVLGEPHAWPQRRPLGQPTLHLRGHQ